jgi:SNF2 family DNA or RNA helicase
MLKFSEDIKSTAFNDAALSNKCRQFLQGAVYTDTTGQRFGPKPYKQLHDIKAQMLKELCDYMPGKPILAAFQYRFELDIFNRVFNYRVPYIAGGISGVESTTILQKWNLGTIPLLLVHPASVSHGLNLQEAGCTLVWVALPWSLEQYLQLLGRLRRSGQKNVVGVHNFLFKDTIDDRIGRVLAMRDASQQDLLDALKEEFGYGHSRSGR